jgi:hypothetical protein
MLSARLRGGTPAAVRPCAWYSMARLLSVMATKGWSGPSTQVPPAQTISNERLRDCNCDSEYDSRHAAEQTADCDTDACADNYVDDGDQHHRRKNDGGDRVEQHGAPL